MIHREFLVFWRRAHRLLRAAPCRACVRSRSRRIASVHRFFLCYALSGLRFAATCLLPAGPPTPITEQSLPRRVRLLVVSIPLSGRNDHALSLNNGRSLLEHHWELSTLPSTDLPGLAWSLPRRDFSGVSRGTTRVYRMSFRRVECARQLEPKAPVDWSRRQARITGTPPVRPF